MMTSSVTAILLAAGAGTRLGRPKALLTCPAGTPIIADHIERLHEAGINEVVVVLGAAAAEVRALLPELPGGVRLVECPAWEAGMGESLRTGLAEVESAAREESALAAAALVMLADLVAIPAGAHERLAAYAQPQVLARCAWGGTPGHPVLIGREHFAGVAASAAGDTGARDHLRTHADAVQSVECGDLLPDPQLGLFDVDTPADLDLWHSWGRP